MKWARFNCGGGDAYAQKTIALPTEYWLQADVYIPASTLTACSDGDLFGFTAGLLGVMSSATVVQDAILGFDSAPPTGAWKWETERVSGSITLLPATTYTVKAHVNGTSIQWFVNAVSVHAAYTIPSSHAAFRIGGWSSEGCSCETYFVTNVKLGTTDGGSDLFADDFSSGDFSNWSSTTGIHAVVDAPSECVAPIVSLHPSHGCWASRVTIVGSGFAPDSPLTVSYDSLLHPVAFSTATTDGSGDFTGFFLVPPGFVSGSYDVIVADGEGNFASATFEQCCNTAADAPDSQLPTQLGPAGDVTPTTLTPVAYIHHQGAHWFAYRDASTDDASSNLTTFPPPTNHTLNVYRVPDDGSGITKYEVDSDYCWGLDSTGGSFITGTTWETCLFFDSWSKPIHDLKFASDGDNLWLALVSERTELYPYISADDIHNGYPSMASQFIDLATLTMGFTYFPTSCDSTPAYTRHIHLAIGAIDQYIESAPYSDAGNHWWGYWNVPYLAMYVFDGGGFSPIGTEDRKYCPDSSVAATNVAWNAILGTPPIGSTGAKSRLFTGVAVSASPEDPGVCHAVWSEGGVWGRYGEIGSSAISTDTWDGNPPNIDYRTVYTRWSTGGKTLSSDIFHLHVDRTNAFFPFDLGLGVVSCGYTWPALPDVGSGVFQVRNSGIPMLLHTKLELTPDIEPPDSHGNPWLDYKPGYAEPTVTAYDLSSGGAVAVASITPDLLPTTAEQEAAGATGSPPVPNFMDRIWAEGYVSLNEASGQPGSFSVSLPYDDPLLGKTVYLVAPLWISLDVAHNTSLGLSECFYRIPADGSAGFDFLDGLRAPLYSILAAANSHGFTIGVGAFDTFFSDTRNVWAPEFTELWQLPRICDPTWFVWTSVTPPLQAIPFRNVPGAGMYWDPTTDALYYAAVSIDDPGAYFVAQVHICRNCRPCQCAESGGVHVNHRFNFAGV